MPGGKGKLVEWQKENPDKVKSHAKEAGVASGKARREKRMLRDYLDAILSKKSEAGTLYDEITIALIEKAMEGDVSAYNTIRDTLGQKPKDEISMDTDNTINIKISSDD